MREDAIYHMASMTKPVTAVALMQQVELGRVALTDEVRKYIPELTGFRVAERDEKGEIRIDPRKQFSKKLARWTAVFWFLFMTWLSVIFLLAPASALYCVYMGIIVTVVMIVNVWAYTQNSIYEKAAFAMLSKAKIEIGLKNAPGSAGGDDDDDQEPEEASNG